MAVLVGVLTEAGKIRQAESSISGLAGYPVMDFRYFKVGEGGWMYDGTVKVPKDPSPLLTDIEADGSPGNTFFQKNLLPSDVSIVAGSATSKLVCVLDLLEGNDNGYGEPPKYFEIGIFDSTGTMIVYGTFPEETKNSSKILTHNVLAVF